MPADISRQRSRQYKFIMPADLLVGVQALARHENSTSVAQTVRRLLSVGLRRELAQWNADNKGRADDK
jgi:hypothetical protein